MNWIVPVTPLSCDDDIQFYLVRLCYETNVAIGTPKKRVIAVPTARVVVVKFIDQTQTTHYILYQDDTNLY